MQLTLIPWTRRCDDADGRKYYIILQRNRCVNKVSLWEVKRSGAAEATFLVVLDTGMTMARGKANETAALPKFRQRYRKSEVIFEEGSAGGEMYLIHSGRVLLSVRGNEAERKPLVILNPGDFFGEMALVDDSPRSTSASAVEDGTELIVMDRARFLFMVRQQPEFALSVLHTLCQRLRDMNTLLSLQEPQRET